MAGPGGRKRKRSYNTSGFKQHANARASVDPHGHSRAPSPSNDDDGDEEIHGAYVISDSVKQVCIEEEDNAALTDIEETDAWDGIDDEELSQQLVHLAICLDDDRSDMTWMLSKRLKELQKENRRKLTKLGNDVQFRFSVQKLTGFMTKGRPSTYRKGPDIGSRAPRTQRRYRELLRGQQKLDTFFQPVRHSPVQPSDSDDDHLLSTSLDGLNTDSESTGPPVDLGEVEDADSDKHLSTPPADHEATPATDQQGSESEAEEEGWEDELDTRVLRAEPDIHDWATLRERINNDLRNTKNLPQRHINQLLIIRNFATLRLKGLSRIKASVEIARQWHESEGIYFSHRVRSLARHYQIFEQLPKENRGGTRAHSLLLDERVKTAVTAHLTSLKSGQVSPQLFCDALNNNILPSLGFTLKKPLCTRTARRWLVKLGWRRTLLKKGVYMDGHEREDVKKYRQEVFLPAMAKYERRMVHFEVDAEGSGLKRIEPVLAPNEKKVVALFHDESCFHANEYKSSAW